MKNQKLSFLLAILILVVFSTCKKDDDPIPQSVIAGWAVGTSDGVYGSILHTSDGGDTWIRQGDSLMIPNAGFNDIIVYDALNLLVCGGLQNNGQYNVMRSVDGGDTWFRVESTVLEDVTYGGLCHLGKDDTWMVGDSGNVYYSDDMGDTWSKIEIDAEYEDDIFLRVAAKSKYDIWIVGEMHMPDTWPIMLHSTNGGTDWERLNPLSDLDMQDAETGHYLGIKIYNNSIWAIGGFGQFVIRSPDNGENWEDVTASGGFGDCNDIFLISETEAYTAQDNSGIFHTTDGGQQWDNISYTTGNWYLGIDILHNKDIWIVGSPNAGNTPSAIIYSSNKGADWINQTPQILIDDKNIGLYKVRFYEYNK